MSQPFFYFVGLILILSYPLGLEPLHFARHPSLGGVPVVLPATGAFMLLCGAVTWAVWRRWKSPMAVADLAVRILPMVLFSALVYVFHLPLWVWSVGLEDDPLLGGLLSLAPLAGFYGIQAFIAARRRRPAGPGGPFPTSLAFAFRVFVGLSLAPVVLVLSAASLFQRVSILRELAFVHPLAAWVPVMGVVAVLLALLPAVLRLAFGARPLPPGPLRDRLVGLAAAAGVPRARLLMVGTGGLPVFNAFVAGLQPWGRTIFFTEPILAGMSPDHLEAVLAHELVHVRRRHLVHYVLMGAGFAAVGAVVQEALAGASPLSLLAAILGMAVLFWLVLFGYVSRRFEVEADLGAARLCGGDAERPFAGGRRVASMLMALGRLNRVPLGTWSWRHFPLLRRIRILLAAGEDPTRGLVWERRCGRLRAAGSVVFLLAVAALGVLQAGRAGENRRRWEAYGRVERGWSFMEQGRFEEAVRELRGGIEGGAEEARFWLWVAECERRLGRDEAAGEALVRARSGFLADPRDRLRVERP